MATIAQINLNNSRGAQDLMYQIIAENKILRTAISEPNNCPEDRRWVSDLTGKAAVYIANDAPSGILLTKGHGYVIIKWANTIVVSVYISPNCEMQQFQDVLTEMERSLTAYRRYDCIIMGDMNARSTT